MTTDEQQIDADSPRGRLLAGVAALVDTFTAEAADEREREAAERAALVHDVAAQYDPARTAADVTLAEAGRVRRAYKLVENATPRLIIEANERDDVGATEIASVLGCSPSYASRIIREHKSATEK
jgi:DNA invertase Pin-like site-specific DNA recombinase